jgi:hypothetical protein
VDYIDFELLSLLRHLPALSDHGFRENNLSDLAAPFPDDELSSRIDYDYESDSDLEDGDDTLTHHQAVTSATSSTSSTPLPEVDPRLHFKSDLLARGRVVVLKGTAFRT